MGKTIVIAEHRIYYLMELVDRVIYMQNGTICHDMPVKEFCQFTDQELHSMGLRSLNPVDFKDTAQKSLNTTKIHLKNLSFSYGKEKVVDIPNLELPQGAIIGILGNNGAGKSTFAKCLAGLEKKATGILEINGKSYGTKQRINISYMVMQDVNHQLFTESVMDEIMLSMPGNNEESEIKNAEMILQNLNLLDFKELHPMALSGGQKQRVAIGSALAADKKIILFDEPTSGLDYKHMLEVSENIKRLSGLNKTLFIITHDPELLAQCCNYLMFIEHGKCIWSGNWTNENKNKLRSFFTVT